jgi:very-short-patch-repair endonuclease
MPRNTEIARKLRNTPTLTESLLWGHLRSGRLLGYKFTRQFPVGPYVVDFCCRSERLIVELDGGGHDLKRDLDAQRTKWIEGQDYRVVRFWNTDVLQNMHAVLEVIAAHLKPMAMNETDGVAKVPNHTPPRDPPS